jgi:creatinine amidohydrolase
MNSKNYPPAIITKILSLLPTHPEIKLFMLTTLSQSGSFTRMKANKVKWEEMLPDEFLDAIDKTPVCYMAYGLAEPHGAYNALGLDWLKAYQLCLKAAQTHGGIVAPPFCWHVQETPMFDFPAMHGVKQSLSSSIPGDLFLHIVLHQMRAFDARGFHVAILITGHYGGLENDMRLLGDFYQHISKSPLQIYCIADWECIDYQDYRGDHAGMCETQQLMALRPELVDLTQPEPSPTSGPWLGTDFTRYSQQPDAETGLKIVNSQIENLGKIQTGLLQKYTPKPNWTPPNQDKVVEMWHTFERLTRKYWSLSTTKQEYRKGKPPFPGWESLGV